METRFNGKPNNLIIQHLESIVENDLLNEYMCGLESLRVSKTKVIFSTTYYDFTNRKFRAIIIYKD